MRRTQVALTLFIFLLIVPLATGGFTAIGWDTVFGTVGILLSALIVASMVLRRQYRMQSNEENRNRHCRDNKKPQGTEHSDDGEGEGFWSSIPNRQYNGRFAEAGGLTRNEQSDAIKKVQANAEEIEKDQR